MKNACFAFLIVAFLGFGNFANAGGHNVLRVVQPQAILVQPQAILVNPYAIQAPQAIVVQGHGLNQQLLVVDNRQRIVVRNQPQRIVVQQQRIVVRNQPQRITIRGPLGGRITFGR